MGNETEKDLGNKRSNLIGTVDPSQKNPSHQGGQSPNQQDPSKQNPPRIVDSRQRDSEESSEQTGNRRVSSSSQLKRPPANLLEDYSLPPLSRIIAKSRWCLADSF
jgi:hypothetical protein